MWKLLTANCVYHVKYLLYDDEVGCELLLSFFLDGLVSRYWFFWEVPRIFERCFCCGDGWFIDWGMWIATVQTGLGLTELNVRLSCSTFGVDYLVQHLDICICFFLFFCCLFCYGILFVFCCFTWTCEKCDLNDNYGHRFQSLYSWRSLLCSVGLQKKLNWIGHPNSAKCTFSPFLMLKN